MSRSITEHELAFALNCYSIDNTLNLPDYALARKLVDKVEKNRGSHPSLATQAPRKVVSIQLAATIDDGDTFAVVPKADDRNTHWSIYLRHEDGEVTYVADFPRNAGRAYSSACEKALELSIKHKAPIEPIP